MMMREKGYGLNYNIRWPDRNAIPEIPKFLQQTTCLPINSTSRRRTTLSVAGFFLICVIALISLFRRHEEPPPPPPRELRPSEVTGVEPEILGMPGIRYPASDNWFPPMDWDPRRPVFGGMPSLDDRYDSSISNKTSSTGEKIMKQIKYEPYPKYNSPEYKEEFRGTFVSCVGPRGIRLDQSEDDQVTAYTNFRKTSHFPEAQIGSSREIGLDQEMCFDRRGRFSPYGNHYSVSKDSKKVDWDKVNWAKLQQQCVTENADRFDFSPRPLPGEAGYVLPGSKPRPQSGPKYKPRTAVLFRGFDNMVFTGDIVRTMRSVITELALKTGGEYQAFLLVQVKDNDLMIHEDEKLYKQIIMDKIPKEFQDITVLWSENRWKELYPMLPEGELRVHISQWLPVQQFLKVHPEFDHYWNWEMDVRFTGHHYELIDKLDQWSKKQPRKGMWERSSRFYIPRYYGDFTTFRDYIQSRYINSSIANRADQSVWGPSPPKGQATLSYDGHAAPNTSPDSDQYEWGVGEEADLITMLPMFNTRPTRYANWNHQWGYDMEVLGDAGPPRKTTIVTFYRLSHRLISLMEFENVEMKRHMSSETWPQSVALHHGLKAVYAPHSMWMQKRWPAKALNYIFNFGDTVKSKEVSDFCDPLGEGSGGADSPFGLEREFNFEQTTWYWRTNLAEILYTRMMGFERDGIGGSLWEEEKGEYCLPGMLLHPIKPFDDPPEEEDYESVLERISSQARKNRGQFPSGVIMGQAPGVTGSPENFWPAVRITDEFGGLQEL